MEICIRPAVSNDAPGIFDVKEQIRLPADAKGEDRGGGFLLGTDLEQYRYFIAHDQVMVAEHADEKRIVGFAIVLKHESVTNSVLWQRAQEVRWEPKFEREFDGARVSFFEQLGFLPDPAYRVYAKYLAFASVDLILKSHAHLFTTVLREPVYNRAVLAFIRVTGFEPVGMHTETYPEYGRIVSEVFHLDRTAFQNKIQSGKFAQFMKQMRERGYGF